MGLGFRGGSVITPSDVSTRSAGEGLIRLASEKDLVALETLDKEVFADLAYSMHYLRTFFNLFRGSWWVADHSNDLAGYALVGLDSHNSEAWLLGLAVSARHQGKGLGKRLMDHAMAVMHEAGVNDGYITVRPDNAAAYHLYQSFGFT